MLIKYMEILLLLNANNLLKSRTLGTKELEELRKSNDK